jgi:hypothetical protein
MRYKGKVRNGHPGGTCPPLLAITCRKKLRAECLLKNSRKLVKSNKTRAPGVHFTLHCGSLIRHLTKQSAHNKKA